MKKILLLLVSIIFNSCSPDNLKDCLSNPGQKITIEYQLNNFEKINVSEGIEVNIIQSNQYKVEIIAGKNILNNIEFEVVDSELFLKNSLECTLGATKFATINVYVPNLTHIYSNSQYNIKSTQVLNFPSLILSQGIRGDSASCIIDLQLNSENLVIENNNLTYFKLAGNVTNLEIQFWSGLSRFEAANLISQHIKILHRSSNNMYLNPIQSITGDIYSVGNVYINNIPNTINVQEHYTGRLFSLNP